MFYLPLLRLDLEHHKFSLNNTHLQLIKKINSHPHSSTLLSSILGLLASGSHGLPRTKQFLDIYKLNAK